MPSSTPEIYNPEGSMQTVLAVDGTLRAAEQPLDNQTISECIGQLENISVFTPEHYEDQDGSFSDAEYKAPPNLLAGHRDLLLARLQHDRAKNDGTWNDDVREEVLTMLARAEETISGALEGVADYLGYSTSDASYIEQFSGSKEDKKRLIDLDDRLYNQDIVDNINNIQAIYAAKYLSQGMFEFRKAGYKDLHEMNDEEIVRWRDPVARKAMENERSLVGQQRFLQKNLATRYNELYIGLLSTNPPDSSGRHLPEVIMADAAYFRDLYATEPTLNEWEAFETQMGKISVGTSV